MANVSYKLKDLEKRVIKIGYVGENDHMHILLDCKETFDEYPNAVVTMAITPPAGEQYPKTVTRTGNIVEWLVKNSDVAAEGDGEFQLTFTENNVVKKSVNGRFEVERSIVATGTAPSGVDDWLTDANEKLAEAEEATGAATDAASAANAAADAIDDMTVAASGLSAGASPTVQISDVSGHKHIAFGIPKGDKGDPGDPTELIDDTTPASNKTFSSSKVNQDLGGVLNAINILQPEASASDVGKALLVKTVENGKPTSYEYGEAGGVDPSIVEQEVDTWLGEHISNPSNPPLDRSLSSSSAAAPADLVGEVKGIVLETATVDLMANAQTMNVRISASDGSTAANSNWTAYIIDVEDIDETFTAKMYDKDISYASVVFYSSKTTFTAQTCVGTPMTAEANNSYLEVSYADLTIPSTAVCAVFANNKDGNEAYIHEQIKTVKVYSKTETDALIASATSSIPSVDKTLAIDGAAADAKKTGEIKDVVFAVTDVDLLTDADSRSGRIVASDGSTDNNANWTIYIIDIDDIDDTFSAKLYSSNTQYANIAFYTSKTTLSSETVVGTPISAASDNSYLEVSYSDMTIPDTAVCIACCNNKNGSAAFVKKQTQEVNVYTKEETGEQIDEAIDEIEEEVEDVLSAFNEEIDINLMGTATQMGVRVSVSDGSTENNSNWNGYLLDVTAIDDNFSAKLYSNNTAYAVCAFYSSKTTLSSETCVGSPITVDTASTYKEFTKSTLTIPTGAVCVLFINNKSGNEAYIKTKLTVKKIGTGGRFTLIAANCNHFPDGESVEYPLTTAEYRTHWRNLLNDSRIDFMAISEYNDGVFGEETVQQALFADSMPYFKSISDGVGMATACRMNNTLFVDKIEVTSSITYDGVAYTTTDKYVMKTEVIINGISVIVYSVKLCPSGANPSETKLAWTKAMRQAQYQDILDDIEENEYTHYIICGDFNAQDCSQDNEYKIFTDAGLTICNGGYLGWFSTLRNINADNIIFPSTIKLVRFKVLNDYVLNTDHYPILAELQINP